MTWLFFIIIAAFLLGSIPFGLILTRIAGIGDLRTIGSGNIGATNVMRTGHKGLGVLTLLLDGGKGFLAVWFARYMYAHSSAYDFSLLAALAVVIGHIFSPWLRFKGGKGVATSIGVFFALNPFLGLIVCIIWLTIFACTRTSSLAAIISIGCSWMMMYLLEETLTAMMCLLLGLLIIYTHRSNIRRLLEGNEHMFPKNM